MLWSLILGLRLIQSRKRGHFFSPMMVNSALSIAFGITALLVCFSVFTGFQSAYQKAILGFNAHLVVINEQEIKNVGEVVLPLKNFPEVEGTSPFLFREGLGLVADGVTSVVLKGIDPGVMKKVYPVKYESYPPTAVLEESLAGPLPSVIVGKELIQHFFPGGVGENPVITLLIPREGIDQKKGFRDYAQDFRVVGTFESGMYEFDSEFVLTSLEVMRNLFNLQVEASGLEVVLSDPARAPELARLIEKELPSGYQIISWDELNGALFSAMKMEKTLFLVIMLGIVVIASFSVIGIIMMTIWQRRGELAILRAMGASPASLGWSLVLQGMVMAVMGIILGTVFSSMVLYSLQHWKWLHLDPQIYFVSHVPIIWPLGLWGILLGAAFLICVLTARLSSAVALRQGGLAQTFR